MRLAMVIVLLLSAAVVGAQDKSETKARFISYDLVIDAGDAGIAAWQIKLTYDRSKVSIVGIEAETKAPYYDRRGLRAGEIVIANFYTKKNQQSTGKGQVCRLHLRVVGAAKPNLSAVIQALADGQGKRLSGTVSITLTTETGERE